MDMRIGLLAAALLASTAVGGAASASELLFSYSEPGGIDFSFEQSSMPTPIAYSSGFSVQVPVTELSSNIGPFSDIFWYSTGDLGQFDTDTSTVYIVYGPQIYTGPESAPVFAPGVFPGEDQTNGLDGTLTITAVPEPAAWLLMIAGIAGIGLTLRRGRQVLDLQSKDAAAF
jgi:hypothetical protein